MCVEYARNEESVERIWKKHGYEVSFKCGGKTTVHVIYLHVLLIVTNHLSQDAFPLLCQSP